MPEKNGISAEGRAQRSYAGFFLALRSALSHRVTLFFFKKNTVATAANGGSRDVTWASQPTPLISFRVFSRVSRAPSRLGISISRRTNATRKSCASELKAVCLEKDYEHHPFNCSDPVFDRRAANLAIQRRLGLLSDRRRWPAGSDRVDSRLVRTHLVGLERGAAHNYTDRELSPWAKISAWMFQRGAHRVRVLQQRYEHTGAA